MTENLSRPRPYAVALLGRTFAKVIHAKCADDAAEAFASLQLGVDIPDGESLMEVSVHLLSGPPERYAFEIVSTIHDGLHARQIGETDDENNLIETAPEGPSPYAPGDRVAERRHIATVRMVNGAKQLLSVERPNGDLDFLAFDELERLPPRP